MNKNIGIVVGVLVIAGIAFFTLSGETKTDTVKEDSASETELTSNDEETTVASGSFETYSSEKVAAAPGDVVIFFHASWCPSCRTLSANIDENTEKIPLGTTILKADYDTETELKKKYGVTTQHTLVQVDKDGNMIKKWSGGSKLENLLREIQ